MGTGDLCVSDLQQPSKLLLQPGRVWKQAKDPPYGAISVLWWEVWCEVRSGVCGEGGPRINPTVNTVAKKTTESSIA